MSRLARNDMTAMLFTKRSTSYFGQQPVEAKKPSEINRGRNCLAAMGILLQELELVDAFIINLSQSEGEPKRV